MTTIAQPPPDFNSFLNPKTPGRSQRYCPLLDLHPHRAQPGKRDHAVAEQIGVHAV